MDIDIWILALSLSIISIPLYCLWERDKPQRAVMTGKKTKVEAYRSTISLLWLPTLFLFFCLAKEKISLSDLYLIWQGSLNNWLGFTAFLLVIAYFVYSLIYVKNNKESHEKYRKGLDHVAWFMPMNSKELGWFTGGVSMSAGICEELLFRGVLWLLLTQFIGLWPALVVSSMLFGLAHIYQGWANVFRTAIMGVVLGLVLWLSESMWIAIALHAALDIYGGLLAYIVFNSHNEEKSFGAETRSCRLQ